MEAVELIRRLHEHRRWANGRLLASAAVLGEAELRRPFQMGRGSLWATLVHLYGAEHVWLEVLLGRAEAVPPGPGSFESLEQLQVAWTALDRRWQRYLDELTDARLDRPVVRVRANGARSETPARDVLMHVCTHAQYTSAQAVNMLRQLGAPVPDLQLITLSREGAGRA